VKNFGLKTDRLIKPWCAVLQKIPASEEAG